MTLSSRCPTERQDVKKGEDKMGVGLYPESDPNINWYALCSDRFIIIWLPLQYVSRVLPQFKQITWSYPNCLTFTLRSLCQVHIFHSSSCTTTLRFSYKCFSCLGTHSANIPQLLLQLVTTRSRLTSNSDSRRQGSPFLKQLLIWTQWFQQTEWHELMS